MYYEAVVLLRYDTTQSLNEDTVRAYLHGHVGEREPFPCEFAIMSLRTVEPDVPWARQQQALKASADVFGRVLNGFPA
jgi:hypothetical protein